MSESFEQEIDPRIVAGGKALQVVIEPITAGLTQEWRDSMGRDWARLVLDATPASDKTFTEAELMAEYWAAHGEANQVMTGNPHLRFSQRHTLRKFATTPSYSEVEG